MSYSHWSKRSRDHLIGYPRVCMRRGDADWIVGNELHVIHACTIEKELGALFRAKH